MDITTVNIGSRIIEKCPVILFDDGEVIGKCDQPLHVFVSTDEHGDDYGAWVTYSVDFYCGHTFEDMESSLRNEEYL